MPTIRDGRKYALALGMSASLLLVGSTTARAQSAPDAGVRDSDAGAPPTAVAPVAAPPAADAPAPDAPPQDAPPVDVATPEEAAAAPATEEGVTSATGFACAEIMDDNGNVQRLRRNGIVGLVKDAATGETIIEGAVQVVGGRRVFTNYDGCFQIELPPGTYTLRVFYDLYQTARVTNIVVRRGEGTEVTVDLQPDTETLAEVVVTARADRATEATQLELRRQSASVSDSVSAQEIARSPDNTASQAVRRVVGATVQDGQYLFVRGLGGRYTNVLLNGTPVPSADPDYPGVQLDLFPAAVLSSLTIYKTPTADLPGNAAGGTMVLTTREFPTRFTFGITAQTGFNLRTTFQDSLNYRGGGTDFLGFDDGTRSVPDAVASRRLTSAEAIEDPRAIGGQFPARFALTRDPALPNGRLGINVGDTLDVGGRRLGYLLTLAYQRNFQRLVEKFTRVELNGGVTTAKDDFGRESLTQSTLLGALGAMSLELDEGDELSLTVLASQASEDYAGSNTGFDGEDGTTINQRRLRFVQRSLLFGQFGGEHRHVLGSARLNWQLNGSLGQRYEPDTRDVRYEYENNRMYYFWRPGVANAASRLYLDAQQVGYGGRADLAFALGNATAKIGTVVQHTQQDFTLRRFSYDFIPGVRVERNDGRPPEDLFGAQLGEYTYLFEETLPTDGFVGEQTTTAGYAQIDWPALDWLRLVGGVRGEGFRQTVQPATPFSEESARQPEIARTDLDLLPSASAVVRVASEMYVRLGYGASVARPNFRELAPVPYPDFVRRRNLTGEPTLRRSRIESLDLRWEWFPGSTEVLAVSGFAKFFDSPIETTIVDENFTAKYQNVDGARNFGGEVEARLSLGRLTDALSAFSIGGNFSLVYSQAVLSASQKAVATNAERPMAGQSPYVANLSLGFAPNETGFDARIYYNVAGPRLVEVGINENPDVYQVPFHAVDVVVSYTASEAFSFKASFTNILDSEYALEQGEVVSLRYRPGPTVSVSATWTP